MVLSEHGDSENTHFFRRASENTNSAIVADQLQAEVERLLSGRIRDIALSTGLFAIYQKQSWKQRQKIVHSWMVWVSIISIGMVALSPFLIPDVIVMGIVICAGVVPLINAAIYLTWRKPRASAVEGAIIALWGGAIVLSYGYLGSWSSGWVLERYLTGAIFVVSLGILVLGLELRWTLATAAAAALFFLIVQLGHPDIAWQQAVALTCFYSVGLLSACVARHTATLLAHRTFLMGQRDRHRSEALAAANRQLEQLAAIDPLTGISNRREATDLVQKLWTDASVDRNAIAFLMIDIDNFKRLNDTRGHAAGDDCIRLVASTIASSVRRRMDIVSRYGGEEFLVVLTKTSESNALDIAERIRMKIEDMSIPNHAGDTSAPVTVSIGMAMARTTCDPESVAKLADEALYAAKHQGRNRVCSANIDRLPVDRRAIAQHLAIVGD